MILLLNSNAMRNRIVEGKEMKRNEGLLDMGLIFLLKLIYLSGLT